MARLRKHLHKNTNVTLILQVFGIIFLNLGKTNNHPFLGLFRGAFEFFVEGASTFLAPKWPLTVSRDHLKGQKSLGPLLQCTCRIRVTLIVSIQLEAPSGKYIYAHYF